MTNLPGNHQRVVGSCGHVIFQCRCPASAHNETRVARKCHDCLRLKCARNGCNREIAYPGALYCGAACSEQEGR